MRILKPWDTIQISHRMLSAPPPQLYGTVCHLPLGKHSHDYTFSVPSKGKHLFQRVFGWLWRLCFIVIIWLWILIDWENTELNSGQNQSNILSVINYVKIINYKKAKIQPCLPWSCDRDNENVSMDILALSLFNRVSPNWTTAWI